MTMTTARRIAVGIIIVLFLVRHRGCMTTSMSAGSPFLTTAMAR
jgi:hypothetical protein